VKKNSPADGKLKIGDLIISIDNYSVFDITAIYVKSLISNSPSLILSLKIKRFFSIQANNIHQSNIIEKYLPSIALENQTQTFQFELSRCFNVYWGFTLTSTQKSRNNSSLIVTAVIL